MFLNLVPNYKVHEFNVRNKISADTCMDFFRVSTARISNVTEGDRTEVE